MYKQTKDYVVTIQFSSDNNHPRDWDLENGIFLEHGELLEILDIVQVEGKPLYIPQNKGTK